MASRKSCWTCKDRRIRCDGGSPKCQKCIGARRCCQGYGMRLSWPRDDDKKRVTSSSPPSALISQNRKTDFPFINTTWSDIELYHHQESFLNPVPRLSNLSNLPQLSASNMQLLNYFHDSAHLSLVTFDADLSQMRDVLIRMALENDTLYGYAIFYALLAFSSFHHCGLNQQTMRLKISALHFLAASAKEAERTWTQAARQAAASMLLGALDIMLPSASSGEWLWYTRGAMDIVQTTCLKNRWHESDIGRLLDWVYYHDTLSRFPLRHWQHESLAREVPETEDFHFRGTTCSDLTKYRPALSSPNPTYAILNLLSESCDALIDPRDPASRSGEYRDSLDLLKRRIGNVHLGRDSSSLSPHETLGIEVWQTATQIYLARASQCPGEEPANLESLIDMAFEGPIRTCACPHFFPLFILACEARSDDRRASILSLIGRTEDIPGLRSKVWLRNMIRSIWVHQDLHADGDLLVNYVGAMRAVINMNDTIPSFV
ncbi:Zinc-finger transcription factor [Metarhizium guizhouense ARSEF 977]|uniref:Zinc-finger transcription factor n=1 Tax=Metarhizium guizhouense (strain ARSEF 977) TaxID=1276136 RepID=A0A0B4I0M7_METGA|nr:Zinc-finger transcription factor [Metarhizium guizhouense ARSEF 977]